MRQPLPILLLLIVPIELHASPRTPAQESIPSAPSQSVSADIAEARRLSQQGKNAEALARLQALAANNPGLAGLSHELGIAYYKSGDYVKAIEALQKATQE